MPSNHLILCHPLLLLLPSIFPSIRIFSNELALCIRWPKYCSFSFSISLSNEYSGLISFRMDWLDLLAVQRTLKSVLQQDSSKASIFWWGGSKITTDGDYSHEIKRHLLLGRKVETVTDFIFLGSKITAVMKLKDVPWKESYDKPRQCIKK